MEGVQALAYYVFAGSASYGDGLNITLISACVLGGIKFTGGKGSPLCRRDLR